MSSKPTGPERLAGTEPGTPCTHRKVMRIPVRHDIRLRDCRRGKTRNSKHETGADRLEHHVPQQLFVNEVEQLYGCDRRQIMRIGWRNHENWLQAQ